VTPAPPLLAHGSGSGALALHLALPLLLVVAAATGVLVLRGSPRRAWRSAAWLLALGALGVALSPPLEAAAARSLTAHMTQHLALVLVAAPLAALVVERRAARTPWPVLVAAGLHVAVVTGWHLPVLYELALGQPLVHAVEHATFLLVGFAFWTGCGAAVRSAQPARLGAAALATVAVSVAGVALGLAMTFSPTTWYVAYPGPRALADQQVAGMLMWGAGGPVYLAATAWIVLAVLRGGAQVVAEAPDRSPSVLG
jgi:putative membrane protein